MPSHRSACVSVGPIGNGSAAVSSRRGKSELDGVIVVASIAEIMLL